MQSFENTRLLRTRDPRPATRDPRPATRDPRPATRDPRPATIRETRSEMFRLCVGISNDPLQFSRSSQNLAFVRFTRKTWTGARLLVLAKFSQLLANARKDHSRWMCDN